MGSFKRHGHVLPLEMYLEEGLPLVCYMREQRYAEMVELPEQSCHFFMSWSNAAAPVPSLKVRPAGHRCCGNPQRLWSAAAAFTLPWSMHPRVP